MLVTVRLGHDPECWIDSFDENSTGTLRDRIQLLKDKVFVIQEGSDRRAALQSLISPRRDASAFPDAVKSLLEALMNNTAGNSNIQKQMNVDLNVGIELAEGVTLTNADAGHQIISAVENSKLTLAKKQSEGPQEYFYRAIASGLNIAKSIEVMDPYFGAALQRRNGGWLFTRFLDYRLESIHIYLLVDWRPDIDFEALNAITDAVERRLKESSYSGVIRLSFVKATNREFHDRWMRLIHERGSTHLSFKNSFDTFDKNELRSAPSSANLEDKSSYTEYLNWVRSFGTVCEAVISKSRGVEVIFN
jgi:hypothetical protein